MKVAAFHASRTLNEAELEPCLVSCGWCGGDDLAPVHTVQAEPPVVLRRCRRCRACGVDRLPMSDALDRFYDGYYDRAESHAVTMDDPARLARRIASYLPDGEPGRSLSVLDLGGGDGTIAGMVVTHRSTGGFVTVVDYDHRRRADVGPRVELRHVSDLEDLPPGSRFDLVVASAVLEHLPRPAEVLPRLAERVAPGGVLYLRTPWIEPFLTAAGRFGLPVDFTFPAHLHDLGPHFWQRLPRWAPQLARFTVAASRPSPVETSLRRHPARTAIAAVAKAPWRVVRRWPFVGGWEHVLVARR